MAFMAFAPLGRGILSGAYRAATDIPEDDRRHKDGRYQPGNFEKNLTMVGKMEEIAAEKGIPVATLALAWVMHQGQCVIPIPSSKSRDHLEENAAAAALELTAEDLARLAAICPPGAAAGVGYPR
jgi:aryl-alcohol dehydrogenase-like predicted oxidoreductase